MINVKTKIMGVVISLALVLFIAGCKDSPSTDIVKDDSVKEVQSEDNVAVEVTEQTTCPVMGGKINKELFVEYKGKKVYFCCGGCEGTFNKDPEKYISKLPQFQQQ